MYLRAMDSSTAAVTALRKVASLIPSLQRPAALAHGPPPSGAGSGSAQTPAVRPPALLQVGTQHVLQSCQVEMCRMHGLDVRDGHEVRIVQVGAQLLSSAPDKVVMPPQQAPPLRLQEAPQPQLRHERRPSLAEDEALARRLQVGRSAVHTCARSSAQPDPVHTDCLPRQSLEHSVRASPTRQCAMTCVQAEEDAAAARAAAADGGSGSQHSRQSASQHSQRQVLCPFCECGMPWRCGVSQLLCTAVIGTMQQHVAATQGSQAAPGLYPEVDDAPAQPTAPPMTAPQHDPLISGKRCMNIVQTAVQ